MKRHLQCAEQHVSPSNLTKYRACHTKWLACLIVVTYETSFPMRGATGITIQPHQILRLPRKMTLQDFKENLQKQVKRHFQCGADPSMIRAWSEHDPSMIRPWKRKPQPASQVRLLFQLTTSIFYCKIQRFAPNLTFKPSPNTAPTTKRYTWPSPSAAPATKSDTWGSPSTAPATQNDSHAWSSSHMKPHFQCAEQQVSRSNLTKYCAWHEIWHCKISKKISKNRWNVISNAGPIRAWSEHDPSMIRAWSDHENANRNPPRKWGYFSSSPRAFSIVKYNVSRPILHSNLHQILRLPQKDTLDLHQVLHLPRKVTLEVHQVLRLPHKMTRMLDRRHIWNLISNARSNRYHDPTSPNTAPGTKYDTARFQRKSPKTGETSFPMRGRSEHDPSMIRAWSDHENANRNPPRKWGYFSSSPRAFSIVKYNVSRPILHSNLHQILRLPRKVTLERHQVLHLPRKVTLELHQVLHLPRKVTLELHYSTLLDSTWLYSTWLYLTLLYLTLLDSTWLYLTLLDSTWL